MKIYSFRVCLLILVIFFSCRQEEKVKLKYENNFIHVDFENGNLNIPFHLEKGFSLEKEPVFYLDSLDNLLYVFIPSFGIKCYNLNSQENLYNFHFDYKYLARNHSFRIYEVNNNLVFSSYLQVLLFNKKLELIANFRDSIESNLCPEFALHDFRTEQIGDTLLFKSLIIEKNDFKKNKRYKNITKDYEFIINDNTIECNNCDRCKQLSPSSADVRQGGWSAIVPL